MSLRPLCPELAKKAREELNEDPKTIENDLKYMKDWLSKQPHLRARLDDQWLIAFLRGCKFSLERTKEKLDLYYSMRSLAPELFRIRASDPLFKELLGLGTYLMLPKTASPDSPRIVIIRAGGYDPAKYKFVDIFSAATIIQRLLIYDDDQTIISGIKTIMDMEGVSVAHYLQVTPGIMKKMAVLSQDAGPIRMKGTHYINTPPGFEYIFNIIKNILNEKNRKRAYIALMERQILIASQYPYFARLDSNSFRVTFAIGPRIVHAASPPCFELMSRDPNGFDTTQNTDKINLYVHNKNYEELYKHVPQDILPAEYGGKGGNIKDIVDFWQTKVQDYSSWLEDDLKYGSDESKRVGKPRTAETLFGVDGSFRQLEFD